MENGKNMNSLKKLIYIGGVIFGVSFDLKLYLV